MDVTRGTEFYFEGIEKLVKILDLGHNLISHALREETEQEEWENGQVGAWEASYEALAFRIPYEEF